MKMNKKQYNNIINHSLQYDCKDSENPLDTARIIFNNMGVALPQGTIKEVYDTVSTGEYMGWKKCTLEEAKEAANKGIAAMGISENKIVVLSAEDDEQPAQQTASVLTLTDNTPAVVIANLQYYSYSYGSTTGGSGTDFGDGSTIKPIYLIPQEYYLQIINSNLDNALKPNQGGYGNIITYDISSDVQYFTTQRYVEGGLFSKQGWESITYLFVTMPVSKWRESIETVNLYDNRSEKVMALMNLLWGLFCEYYSIPGDGASELIGMADAWLENSLTSVVIDDRSRYISNHVSGKSNDEEVTLLMGAYYWEHKKSNLSGNWSTKHIAYQYPWESDIRIITN